MANEPSSAEAYQSGEPYLDFLNSAVQGYLSVAGLLYALIIAFLYGDVQQRLVEVRTALGNEVSSMKHIYLLVKALKNGSDQLKSDVLSCIMSYINSVEETIANPGGDKHEKDLDEIYAIIPVIITMFENEVDQEQISVDHAILETILDAMLEISEARYQRQSLLNSSIQPLVWTLLSILSAMMFFGVLFLETGSKEMNNVFCLVAVLSITMSNFVLSDIDEPFLGFMYVKLTSLISLKKDIQHSLINRKDTLSLPIFQATQYSRKLSSINTGDFQGDYSIDGESKLDQDYNREVLEA